MDLTNDPIFAHHVRLVQDGIALAAKKQASEEDIDRFLTRLEQVAHAALTAEDDIREYAGHIAAIATLVHDFIAWCNEQESLQPVARHLENEWHRKTQTTSKSLN